MIGFATADRCSTQSMKAPMADDFKFGDHVEWYSEADPLVTIQKKVNKTFRCRRKQDYCLL